MISFCPWPTAASLLIKLYFESTIWNWIIVLNFFVYSIYPTGRCSVKVGWWSVEGGSVRKTTLVAFSEKWVDYQCCPSDTARLDKMVKVPSQYIEKSMTVMYVLYLFVWMEKSYQRQTTGIGSSVSFPMDPLFVMCPANINDFILPLINRLSTFDQALLWVNSFVPHFETNHWPSMFSCWRTGTPHKR